MPSTQEQRLRKGQTDAFRKLSDGLPLIKLYFLTLPEPRSPTDRQTALSFLSTAHGRLVGVLMEPPTVRGVHMPRVPGGLWR